MRKQNVRFSYFSDKTQIMIRHAYSLHLLIAVCCLMLHAQTLAQQPLNSDRPDQSDGVATVPEKMIQIENGVTAAKETLLNNLMIRYGIGKTTEARILIDAGHEAGRGGLKPVTISLKQQLLVQRGILPAITLVGYITPGELASPDYKGESLAVEVKLAFENQLSERFSVGYNLGAAEGFTRLTLSGGLAYMASEKLSGFLEYFSFFSEEEDEHNVDLGVLYLITPVLQADLAFGQAIFDNQDRYFSTLGISYLFR